MPLSIAFRWKNPAIETPRSEFEKGGWGQALTDAADTITKVKDWRWKKSEQERRNRIEDEDRKRRMDWEDKQHQAYGEAADYMRNRGAERDALVKRAEQIKAEIANLKAQLGG
mgnify:CR=1 FL=1